MLNVEELREKLRTLRISQNDFSKLTGIPNRRFRSLVSPDLQKRLPMRTIEENAIKYILLGIEDGSITYKYSDRIPG